MMKLIMVVGILAYASAESQTKAIVKIVGKDKSGQEIAGTVTFNQTADGVEISGKLTGLTEGKHGFHIHTTGDISDGCNLVGSHFNPHNKSHGSPDDVTRHVGDLGNIQVNAQGEANINFKDKVISLSGEHCIIGRALVVHSGEDDLGKGTDPTSSTTGNAGDKIACGVIGILEEGSPEGSSSSVQVHSSIILIVGVLTVLLKVQNYA